MNGLTGASATSTAADDEVEEVDSYTNHDLVEKAFQECDLNHEGRLSYEVGGELSLFHLSSNSLIAPSLGV
jgi:hypothetical protein